MWKVGPRLHSHLVEWFTLLDCCYFSRHGCHFEGTFYFLRRSRHYCRTVPVVLVVFCACTCVEPAFTAVGVAIGRRFRRVEREETWTFGAFLADLPQRLELTHTLSQSPLSTHLPGAIDAYGGEPVAQPQLATATLSYAS